MHPTFITRVLMVSTHHSTGYSLVYLPMYAGYNTYMYMYMYLYHSLTAVLLHVQNRGQKISCREHKCNHTAKLYIEILILDLAAI